MLDDENDKKIKEAADHYHPAYDDTAWDRMEQLLDKHLPQKKKKRRALFILPVLLLGGLVFFMLADNGRRSASPVGENLAASPAQPKTRSLPSAAVPDSLVPTGSGIRREEGTGKIEPKQNTRDTRPAEASLHQPVISRHGAASLTRSNRPGATQSSENTAPGNSLVATPEIKALISGAGQSRQDGAGRDLVQPPAPASGDTQARRNQPVQMNNDPGTKTSLQPSLPSRDTLASASGEVKVPKKKGQVKPGKSFATNFGLGISAGPDVSAVQLNQPGSMAINLGIGLHYALSPAFTLRTGFYAARKIYSVGPDAYQPTAGSGNYTYLKNIDANCLVYSIPLDIVYHFKKVKSHNWFVSAGLVSYLMKKETYEYYYKYPSGQDYTKNWTISNQNQNYLSVLSLSGGYQYAFNQRVSVMAEPYIHLPFSGVGAGKVKLKSGGVLFTLNVRPFLKKGINK